MTSGIKNIMQPKPLLVILASLPLVVYFFYTTIKGLLSVDFSASLIILLSTFLPLIYLIIILLSYGGSASWATSERLEKVDKICMHILAGIKKYYDYVGNGWVFITSATALMFIFIFDNLSKIFSPSGIVSENFVIGLILATTGSGLCFAYKNMINYAEQKLEYRKNNQDNTIWEKTKHVGFVVLFILFIYPMPILTAVGASEQALIAMGADMSKEPPPDHIVVTFMEYLKIIPFFKLIHYD